MLKFKCFYFALLVLVIFSIVSDAQYRNKHEKGSQKFHQKNRNDGSTVNRNERKRIKIPKKYINHITHLIPGLGSLRGRVIISEWSGKSILQFFDIPYGKSPSGTLRFKAPMPVAPWNNILNAEKPHYGCPSLQDIFSYKNFKSKNLNIEDCLRLTVSTKSFTGNAPVMVYIHGDFLYDGSNLEAPPGYLLEENIVLVALRYRLGPFGFLSTMSEAIPGNVGVKDVLLGLQWIQDHITAFGGDASRVTLFGQVAGAAIINVLTMSPFVPEGLFHRVIYQSASALSPAFATDNPLPLARDIGQIAGCTNIKKINSLNKCLLKLNATELLDAYRLHNSKANRIVDYFGAVKFVIGGPSGILPQFPAKILTSGNFKSYPTMGGTVKNPGTFILRDIFLDNLNENPTDISMTGVDYINLIISETNGADPKGVWRKYAEEEILSTDIIKNGSFAAMVPGLIDLCSTISFKNPILLALQGNAQKLPNSTFLYSFDYEGDFSRYMISEDIDNDVNDMPFEMGVSLTDDNLYLFPWPRFLTLNTKRDIKIAKRMVAFWTSFAAFGKPYAPNVPEWSTMNNEAGPYMKISKTISIGENYIDEFAAAVRESEIGFNLLNEEFFERLVDTKAGIDETVLETDNNGFYEKGRGNIIVIAKRGGQY